MYTADAKKIPLCFGLNSTAQTTEASQGQNYKP